MHRRGSTGASNLVVRAPTLIDLVVSTLVCVAPTGSTLHGATITLAHTLPSCRGRPGFCRSGKLLLCRACGGGCWQSRTAAYSLRPRTGRSHQVGSQRLATGAGELRLQPVAECCVRRLRPAFPGAVEAQAVAGIGREAAFTQEGGEDTG